MYAWRLHYWSSALLFALVGVAVVALAGRHRHWVPAARWLPAACAAGAVAGLLPGLTYSATS